MAKDVPGKAVYTLLIYMAKFHYICYNIILSAGLMLRNHLNIISSCALQNSVSTLTY